MNVQHGLHSKSVRNWCLTQEAPTKLENKTKCSKIIFIQSDLIRNDVIMGERNAKDYSYTRDIFCMAI